MAEFKVTRNTPDWLAAIRDKQRPVAEAAVAALRETAATAVQEGRKDIASAGRFGGTWISGLQYRTKGAKEGTAASLDAEATIYHRYGIAAVFEFGATIHGKPLLWIPTTPGGPAPRKSGKKLVSATINGKPMLFDAADRNRQKKPLYVGVPSVTIRKRFHITDIVKRNVENIARLFIKHFKDD